MGEEYSRGTRKLLYPLLLLIPLLVCACAWRASGPGGQRALTGDLWRGYQAAFITAEGRVVRPLDGHDTVSEGQAYAMLMAVWMNDQATFDRCYAWSEANLSRRRLGDSLLAWHFSPDQGVTDWTSAADADCDYALALLLAARRWQAPGLAGLAPYAAKAREVMADILALETRVGPDGRRYLSPGPWQEHQERFILNPSYLAPASWRLFYDESGDPRWQELTESSYHLLGRLQLLSPVGLVPDWCELNAAGEPVEAQGFSHHYGWDALRTPLRIALDWAWNAEPRAAEFLAPVGRFYQGELARRGKVLAVYTLQGGPAAEVESAAAYAPALASLPASREKSKALSKATKLGREAQYSGDYYGASLAWFGLALEAQVTGADLGETPRAARGGEPGQASAPERHEASQRQK